MDPLTHIVVGRAVVAAAGGAGINDAQPVAVGVAAILGALSPDLDGVVAFRGWDLYLRVHQSGTHSLLGALTTAGLSAVLVRLFAPRSRYSALFAAATAGAISHIALDLVSGARIAVGWPLFDRRVAVPLVAMADPWLIGICIAGLLAWWPGRTHIRTAARMVVVAMSLFLAFKAATFALAIGRADLQITEASAVEARWGSLTEWLVYERTSEAVRSTAISTSGSPGALIMSEPVGPRSPVVDASRTLDTVRNFLAVHEFAFPAVQTDGNRTSVLWSDLRYCAPSASQRPLTCGVWAGGLFDRSGRALTQEVRLGPLIQTRRPPE
jgi:membrane-bound metal-dependent hydrolase YbcI (DUF457 family)